jgi:hypothetical protein
MPEKPRESVQLSESTQFEISESAGSVFNEMTSYYENNELDMVLPVIFQNFSQV